MSSLYDALEPEDAHEVQLLARLSYMARENRRDVLAAMQVDDEETLLARIAAGEIAEHPAYEHYLAARILAETHQVARTEMAERLQEINTR